MNVSNRFKRALTKPEKERPVLDLVGSSVEAIADIAMKDDLISAVPIFSSAMKLLKVSDSFRDRMFGAKLLAFIAEAENMTSEQRNATTSKLTKDDEGKKAAETLLLILDKLNDMDKPALLGFLLRKFGEGRVTSVELRRLACAIDTAFADDLSAFLNESDASSDKTANALHREPLVSSGLTRMLTGDTIDETGMIYYRPTELGELLLRLVND
ncbi:MAG: hypothetical protein Q7K57_57560 [Burkholderiaceae bacterium]|nr:hypothetical protein [Polaromonas sp.]MDO8778177.1 hypothetical protein [Burkholderiaceae bacterium]